MDTLDYVLSSSAWSVAGLLVGYTLGRIERDVHEIKRMVREEGNHDDDA